jgi:purine-binding chemotaxis protein CheW
MQEFIDAREVLACVLGGKEVGISLGLVRAIRGCDEITARSDGPRFIRGLRDSIVPVVDAHVLLKSEKLQRNRFSSVVIVAASARLFGIVVDKVSGIVLLNADRIAATGEACVEVDTLLGKSLLLIDVENLMDAADDAEAENLKQILYEY